MYQLSQEEIIALDYVILMVVVHGFLVHLVITMQYVAFIPAMLLADVLVVGHRIPVMHIHKI